ncbi:MAG: tetratricopeptide repeat protein [Trichodesmium sp. St16_bin4-tuft]|nr:tetratricopeptide repeat protein [Trichodesmium sp. St5_bin8]MDE5077697.1 tetratricopeptide repeat protein [Trichodesmium sp. St2_bin6]MDE5091615.1 tetratricopeptide repeat protein [Trichodesmium sp. St18_bin3_1_1]MDE5099108.1 tetratricopeptide repeat protein [Trichodesmium sp. St16_bin4-tuft]MDE5102894.1 tetratricopeptide repeat protein [Trichodesmium sp. St19_bin2]
MDNTLPVLYLLILLLLLSITSIFVIRQITKTRKTESQLSKLKDKLTKEQGTVDEYYQLASIYLEKKLYVQGIELLQKALKLKDPENLENMAKIYNALGFTYFTQEQYDIAIRQYKEALKIDPKYVTAYNNLGHAYEKKKLTAQALEAYESALQYDSKNDTAKRRAESMRKRLTTS